jgi:hypothetical protein
MDSFFSQLLKTITNYCDGQFSIHRLNRLNRLRWTIYVHELSELNEYDELFSQQLKTI